MVEQLLAIKDDPWVLQESDSTERQGLFLVLTIGALQTLGRTMTGQDRAFLDQLISEGLFGVFAARPSTARDRWVGRFRDYLAKQDDDQQYFHWLSLLPRLFQFSEWLDQYGLWWRALDEGGAPIGWLDVLRPHSSRQGEGTGIDAPSLSRPLGMGGPLVVRELVRSGFLEMTARWAPYCFTPTDSLLLLLEDLGFEPSPTPPSAGNHLQHSQAVYSHLTGLAGAEVAAMDGSFDIPLQILADDLALRAKVIG